MNICMIPARAGSKRLPNKNKRLFWGKPIIEYSFCTALEIERKHGIFDKIIVSTDDKFIKAIIPKNIELHEREKYLCDDKSEFLDILKAFPYEYDNLFLLYPCAPMVDIVKVIEGLKKLELHDAIYPIYEISEKRYTCEIDYENVRPLEDVNKKTKLYSIAGNWIWFKKEYIMKTNNILGGNLGYVIHSELEVQDIDIESDWLIAEMKYKYLKGF